jgi:transposase
MTPGDFLARVVSLPELELNYADTKGRAGWMRLSLESVSVFRACPHCAGISESTYDHRWVKILDSPLRDLKVELRIRKKRYWCKSCEKPFTELIHGIFKGARLTERLRRNILWCCSRYQSLVAVSGAMGCSVTTVRRSFLAHLDLHFKRHLSYPFPKKLGIDEHFFGLIKKPDFPALSEQKFHTTLVDLKAHRLYRALPERDQASVFDQLKSESGGEGVEEVTMDMSEGYRNVAHALFPNAKITADKFHVLKLLVRSLNQERLKVVGRKKQKNPMGSLLLKNGYKLDFWTRHRIQSFLKPYPRLGALYEFKERLHRLYRCHGKHRAERSFDHLIRDLQKYPSIEPLQTLGKTLKRWREEILHYFESHLTNAMTEGFNTKIKLIKRMAYGFRNPEIYNKRILYACYH